MEKIYSRKKIKLNKKYRMILLIFVISLLTVAFLIKSISPTFNQLCLSEAKSTATKIVNETIDEIMDKYGYNDLITTIKDKNGNIISMQANIATMNKIVSQISLKIQEKIDDQESRDISIRLGTFTGITILSGRGPKVPIRISSVGNLDTKLNSEFTSVGINQSIHRIYAIINCKIDVLTPFNTISSNIDEKVMLAENLIIGNIPDNYFDIGNLVKNN